MTKEEFIKELNREKYSYEIQGNKIVVTHDRNVNLESLTSLPPGVVFRNRGFVYLGALTSLPPGVEFGNGGDVDLRSLIGGYFHYWEGNMEGIDKNRLLNKMIKDGLFNR
jgi:hypothetical protein